MARIDRFAAFRRFSPSRITHVSALPLRELGATRAAVSQAVQGLERRLGHHRASKRRRKSSAVLWAMRNGHPWRSTIAPALGMRADRPHQGVLNHILAVDDRVRHARAVAMQLRPQCAETLLESRTAAIGVGAAAFASGQVHGPVPMIFTARRASGSRPRSSRQPVAEAPSIVA